MEHAAVCEGGAAGWAMASPVDTIEPCQVTELNNLTANHLFGPLQILEMTVAGGVASIPRQP